MRSNVIDLEGMVHRQTEKAVLFSLDGDNSNAVWLPLDAIELENNHPIWTVTLPEQMALDKGLI